MMGKLPMWRPKVGLMVWVHNAVTLTISRRWKAF
jgi:hypothetical protein